MRNKYEYYPFFYELSWLLKNAMVTSKVYPITNHEDTKVE
jgi:hypothetical protein